MTEIEKTREKKSPREWERWLLFATATGMLFWAMAASNLAVLFLSVLFWVRFYHFSDAALHRELVQEIDALRRELEHLRTAP